MAVHWAWQRITIESDGKSWRIICHTTASTPGVLFSSTEDEAQLRSARQAALNTANWTSQPRKHRRRINVPVLTKILFFVLIQRRCIRIKPIVRLTRTGPQVRRQHYACVVHIIPDLSHCEWQRANVAHHEGRISLC